MPKQQLDAVLRLCLTANKKKFFLNFLNSMFAFKKKRTKEWFMILKHPTKLKENHTLCTCNRTIRRNWPQVILIVGEHSCVQKNSLVFYLFSFLFIFQLEYKLVNSLREIVLLLIKLLLFVLVYVLDFFHYFSCCNMYYFVKLF